MASDEEDVYATLLLNDFYLPGALVLAHSLRDAGTTKKLAVLVTTDSVSADAVVQLQKQFDFIVPVERVVNQYPANLHLMNRTDLHSTFTKITLWKQLQFRRIVYMDSDMVALRAPDELFDLPQPFSAAPDIGWPDIFNSGLMVLNPNMGDYFALLAMAERGISFDGADQGLLNMHFKNNFNRLSFTYNVTPSAHYQYLPAFQHFQSSISVAHFIGSEKPWTQGRETHRGSTPYDQMVGRWWSVYDRHYKESSVESSREGSSSIVQYHTKGEFRPVVPIVSSGQEYQPEEIESERSKPKPEEQLLDTTPKVLIEVHEAYVPPVQTNSEKEKEPEPVPEAQVQYSAWDASKAPPPTDSRPEASNFPSTHYDMSSDPTPFKAPERYPDPPKNMYYEVPKTPTYQKPTPIFPWEKDAPKASRVFLEDNISVVTAGLTSKDGASQKGVDEGNKTPTTVSPTTPSISISPVDPWQTYTRGNAWDDVPEIERYIGNLQKNRKGNIQVLQGYGSGIEQVSSPGARRHSIRLTDFPSEYDRPSLPVTPAPIRRPTFWGEERDKEGDLPTAEGVPSQEDWDPLAQLEQLARRQSDVLASKLGGDQSPPREIPLRPLPYGSEGVVSPTYVAQAPPSGTSGSEETPRTKIEEPSFHGPGALFDKDDRFSSKGSTQAPLGPSEGERDALDN
ncbi:related to glycogenin-2 beta [Rhynchosporium secalis]|uniref:glycogenin glucosyltransferase n=1 Tax=Rhynchosporium secalis TaxID=38038 RepID=A0A1E1MJF7_RHYSE|nr:related to glycogenin-2 beta [Rhynchosporium secalis]